MILPEKKECCVVLPYQGHLYFSIRQYKPKMGQHMFTFVVNQTLALIQSNLIQ